MPEEEIILTPEGTDTPQEEANPQQPASEPTAPAQPEAPAPIDYEKKFKEQAKENILLNERIRQEALRRESTPEPTDTEVQSAFPEWEYMSDAEKRSAKLAYKADRTASAIAAERFAEKAERARQTDLEIFEAANPDLRDKAREFKDFANKPQNRTLPLDVLKKAFLYDNQMTPTQPSTPQPGLEQGNGGPRTEEKPKILSGEQLATLRSSDEKAWRQYIQEHDISADI
jgi:hypothetical protein